jgi:hypothetical protein
LVYDGSNYATASSIPDNTKNVFLRAYAPCASNSAATSATSSVSCHNLTIETGLTLGSISQLNVTGNWTNNGTFSAGTGTVLFTGVELQTIHSGASNFNNVIFNNTTNNNADITIVSPMTIEGIGTFTNGIINYSATGSLTFGDNASTNGGSSNSFVYGSVIKTGSIPFLFPIGDITTRDIGDGNTIYKVLGTAAIEPSSSTTVTASYGFTNTGEPDWWEHGGNMDATLHHVSDREYWVINSSVDMTSVSLYWSENAHADGDVCIHSLCDGDNVFVSTDLVVSYWNGTKWIDADYNSGGSSLSHDNGYIQSRFVIPFGAKGNKIITFGSKNNENPLPVDLLSFDAKCENNSAIISWETASEINNAFFTVEKSQNMTDFYEISRVIGAGNSNRYLSYSVTDYELFGGYNYYRLKQVDFDGKATTYQAVSVNCSQIDIVIPNVVVYPNPFTDEINVVFENFEEEIVIIEIFDDLGRIILTKEFNPTQQSYHTIIDLNELKPAVYNFRTKSQKLIFNQKIVKK